MASSFGVSLVLLALHRSGFEMSTHAALLLTIAVTTLCWGLTAFFGPPTDRQTLIEFYRKVRPFGPGWRVIREEAGFTGAEAAASHENIPLALIGWLAGCTVIWSGLFMVGNFLYGRLELALVLCGTFIVSGIALIAVINRLWSGQEQRIDGATIPEPVATAGRADRRTGP